MSVVLQEWEASHTPWGVDRVRVCGLDVLRFSQRFGSVFTNFKGPTTDHVTQDEPIRASCRRNYTMCQHRAAAFFEAVLMLEMIGFSVALVLPYNTQTQVLLTIFAEMALLVFVVFVTPSRHILKNAVHLAVRVTDVSLLWYLYAHDVCEPLGDETQTAFVVVWSMLPYMYLVPTVFHALKSVGAKVAQRCKRKKVQARKGIAGPNQKRRPQRAVLATKRNQVKPHLTTVQRTSLHAQAIDM